jgi:hypothetical protein
VKPGLVIPNRLIICIQPGKKKKTGISFQEIHKGRSQ